MDLNDRMEVPDGGWGWWVVFGTALINIFNQSLVSVFGLLLGPKIETVAGPQGVADVMSISICLLNLSGIAIGPLLQVMSTKRLSQIGIGMVACGMALSGYGQDYLAIVLGYGLFTGIGLGIISSTTFLIINSYFNRNKTMAVGVAMAGTSIGQIMMPILIGGFHDKLGVDNTVYLLSATSFFGIVGTFFFQPVGRHIGRVEVRGRLAPPATAGDGAPARGATRWTEADLARVHRTEFVDVDTDDDANKNNNNNNKSTDKLEMDKAQQGNGLKNSEVAFIPNRSVHASSKAGCETTDDRVAVDICDKQGQKRQHLERRAEETRNIRWYWREMMKGLDFKLLKDPKFCHTITGLSIVFTTNTSFSTFFPLFIENELKLTSMNTSSCLSVLSLMDFVGRITIPFITRRLNVTSRTTFIYGLCGLSVLRSVTVYQTTYMGVFVCAAFTGFARSAPIVNQNVIVADCCKKSEVSTGVGLFMVFKGVFILIVGKFIGYLRYLYLSDYRYIIHLLDIVSGIVVLSWTIESLYNWKKFSFNNKHQRL